MGKILISLFALSSLVFASATASSESTDIVQRTVNFVLFAGILWYLLAKPVKSFFANRSASIADELKSVQDKLNESVQKKKDALAKISEAEKLAMEIVEGAKKESEILNDTILKQCENDLTNIEKAHESKLELAQRRMVASVVEEVLHEVVKEGASELSKDAMVNVILKKVA
ncbi:ATP synthase F0 sector subunit b [hydrothermal vent metagenome]|uniref:ATP synthase F0 sector subunit b n=1 Tax=hydrothermal vent metagenome TaxID=652676 RepID=A0A1W1BT10_9ZZZZ